MQTEIIISEEEYRQNNIRTYRITNKKIYKISQNIIKNYKDRT